MERKYSTYEPIIPELPNFVAILERVELRSPGRIWDETSVEIRSVLACWRCSEDQIQAKIQVVLGGREDFIDRYLSGYRSFTETLPTLESARKGYQEHVEVTVDVFQKLYRNRPQEDIDGLIKAASGIEDEVIEKAKQERTKESGKIFLAWSNLLKKTLEDGEIDDQEYEKRKKELEEWYRINKEFS